MESHVLSHRHSSESRAALLKEQLDKQADFQVIADIFKMLADSSRVRIFWLLCHCEECVVNISALVSMSSPAVSHHLRQLKDSGLIVSRRVGKEVYYRAAQNELSELLHIMIEKTMEVSCPEDNDVSDTAGQDGCCGHEAERYSAAQIETAHRVHEFLTQNLDRRCTIEELSKAFLMNPSTLKEIFKAVYGDSIAAHIKNHRMEYAAARLLESDDSISEIAKSVGYESHSKFSAEFRKMYDVSPAAYRKAGKH